MRSLGRALVAGVTLTLCAGPAWAQDDEAPVEVPAKPAHAEEADPADEPTMEASGAPDDADAAAAKAARRARRRAARAARRQAALDRAAAATAEADPGSRAAGEIENVPAVKAPEPKPTGEGHATATVATAHQDVGPVDATPPIDALAAAATQAEKPPAPASEHVLPGHAPAAAAHPAGSGAAEHAVEQGQHPKFKVTTFIWQLINFGTLLFILIYFGGRQLNRWLRTRHEQLKGEIGEATRLREEAKGRLDAQERRLAELEKEIASVRASMRTDAQAEQARMLATAQERAKRMQDDIRAQIDEQVKAAEAALRAEIADASVKLAAEMVRGAVSFEDERRLAREFVAGFGRSDNTDEEVH